MSVEQNVVVLVVVAGFEVRLRLDAFALPQVLLPSDRTECEIATLLSQLEQDLAVGKGTLEDQCILEIARPQIRSSQNPLGRFARSHGQSP